MAVAITRTDFSAGELRLAASKAKDSSAARRMLAIALVLEGGARGSAAETCGMDRQTLRDWVHRFNAEGLEGLSNRHSAGPSPLLSVEQKAELTHIAFHLRGIGLAIMTRVLEKRLFVFVCNLIP